MIENTIANKPLNISKVEELMLVTELCKVRLQGFTGIDDEGYFAECVERSVSGIRLILKHEPVSESFREILTYLEGVLAPMVPVSKEKLWNDIATYIRKESIDKLDDALLVGKQYLASSGKQSGLSELSNVVRHTFTEPA